MDMRRCGRCNTQVETLYDGICAGCIATPGVGASSGAAPDDSVQMLAPGEEEIDLCAEIDAHWLLDCI